MAAKKRESASSAHKWKPGDQVRLKLGGPKMTVKGPSGEEVVCQWFVNEAYLQEGTFNPNTLEAPDTPGSPDDQVANSPVKLKSGGPPMLVKKGKAAEVICQWFVDGKLQEGEFTSEALESIPESQGIKDAFDTYEPPLATGKGKAESQ
jgi:uncharacterized protein YodC (DUF2158 family)